MERPGTAERPLRVAVIGSGPAGFYTVQHLLQSDDRVIEIDMYERLPTPFGLVRYGVAPDHQKIKAVTKIYHKLATNPRFRFCGNVDYGRHLSLADLKRHYHQVVFSTGAQTDRRLGIPGEDLAGSHSATEFVAWYNGHPDYTGLQFDLSVPAAVVVGVGNVAVDVARILCRTPEELATTDIADYALEALRRSAVRRVYLLGRRGPAQAAFTNPEVKELGNLPDAETRTLAEDLAPDETDPASPEATDKATLRKLEILRSLVDRREPAKSRKLEIRFLVSPTEILGDGDGRVRGVRLVRNRLRLDAKGRLRAEPTDRTDELEAGLVFRSVGYRGEPLPDLPFREDWATVPNDRGRITDGPGGPPLRGLYVAGWIKRGPTGVIGTNKPDAGETVESMLEDLQAGLLLDPDRPETGALERQLEGRGARVVSYPDWLRLDAIEVSRGEPLGRPRVKITDSADFVKALEA